MSRSFSGFPSRPQTAVEKSRSYVEDRTKDRFGRADIGKCKDQPAGSRGTRIDRLCDRPVVQESLLYSQPFDPRGHYCDIHAYCAATVKGKRCGKLRVKSQKGWDVPRDLLSIPFSQWCGDHIRNCAAGKSTLDELCKTTDDCYRDSSYNECNKVKRGLKRCVDQYNWFNRECIHEDVRNATHDKYLDTNWDGSYPARRNWCDRVCPTEDSYLVPDEEGFAPVVKRSRGFGGGRRSHRRRTTSKRRSARRSRRRSAR